eukprot:gnl/TRDRNA2_/TRDRNA2_141534_c0_seq2.p1 gnl/TRDRNA2_/TRDRNA2_141534_c0~~gnl/TRDRNA2_/TRDRNA2_141534_c0_seq2.p1  ORF type:complete len:142 (-),score=21.66 gnl/TRDRNA2_/TRDRNA2_141534_c0_seq2:2-427(-)
MTDHLDEIEEMRTILQRLHRQNELQVRTIISNFQLYKFLKESHWQAIRDTDELKESISSANTAVARPCLVPPSSVDGRLLVQMYRDKFRVEGSLSPVGPTADACDEGIDFPIESSRLASLLGPPPTEISQPASHSAADGIS